MDTKKQNIHYCTILSSEQWIFLLEGKSSVNRYKCLYRLMSEAVRTKTVYKIKGIEIALEVGQVATSDVELAEYLGCNRKTIGKLIDSFNRLGMLTTKTNNRTLRSYLASPHRLVCRWGSCDQSPLCQTFGYRQRTDWRYTDTCHRHIFFFW